MELHRPALHPSSNAVRKFVGTFESCHYYKGTFQTIRPSGLVLERSCLLHHYGGAWLAHGLCRKAGGFHERASFGHKPSRAQLSAVAW